MDHDLIGKTVADKYLIKRLMGEGGMGAVYEGEHVEIGKRVAVKIINATHAGSVEVAERFRREARAASKVESENIVHVFDVGRDAVVGLYMVMEYLVGEDLAQRLEQQNLLDTGLAISIASQAARALAKAHDVGVIHRDLKPANLFLVEREDGSTQVKILDFGISKLTKDARSAKPSEPPRPLTRAGVVIGTAQYMSPEQAQGLAVDLRTDVWSLGAVLYEAVAGRCAYPELDSYEMTIIQIVTKRPPPLSEVAPWVPTELAAVIHEAMTPELDARLPDCRAFARRLAEVAPMLGLRDAVGAMSSGSLPGVLDARAVLDPSAIGALPRAGGARLVVASSSQGPHDALDRAETRDFGVVATESPHPARVKGPGTGQGLSVASVASHGTSRVRWVGLAAIAVVVVAGFFVGVRALRAPPPTALGLVVSATQPEPAAAPVPPAMSGTETEHPGPSESSAASAPPAPSPQASASHVPSSPPQGKGTPRRAAPRAQPSASPAVSQSQVGGAGLGTQY